MSQQNMTRKNSPVSGHAIGITILGAVFLSACGDSGLEPIRDEALNDAFIAQQAAPTVDLAENNGTPDPIDPFGVTDPDPVDLGQANEEEEVPSLAPIQTPDETPDETSVETSPAIPEGIDLTQFDLVFSDEFQGASLDSRKWNSALPWGPDVAIFDQQQYYVDVQNAPDFEFNPFSFDGEHLTITAQQTPEALRSAANEQPWLSGVITTAENFDLTYGYIEARMDVPGGQGLWPAFWALSSEFEGLRPELYIIEHNGARPNSAFHNYNFQDSDGNLRSPGQWEVPIEGLADGFHTFGVLWSPDEFLFYVDGQPRFRITGENVASQDMFLILNLALGGVWPGATDSSTPAAPTLVIDYVRAYQPRS